MLFLWVVSHFLCRMHDLMEIFWQINGRKVIDFDGIFAIIQTETVKTIQTQAKTCNRRMKMLAEERLSRIMKLLSQQRTATVQELCEALDAASPPSAAI